MKLRIDIYHHFDNSENELILQTILNNTKKIMTDLTTLENEVAENKTVIESAVTLLQGLKAKLDEAGTDAVKLKELSDSLDSNSNKLAEAVAANTPSEG